MYIRLSLYFLFRHPEVTSRQTNSKRTQSFDYKLFVKFRSLFPIVEQTFLKTCTSSFNGLPALLCTLRGRTGPSC
jgi:hypothetical protein